MPEARWSWGGGRFLISEVPLYEVLIETPFWCGVSGLGTLLLCLVSVVGFRVLGFGLRISGFVFWVSEFGVRGSGFGFWVSGFGFRISDFGFRAPGFGFRVSGFEFRVSSFGFRVSGFGFRVQACRRSASSSAAKQRSARARTLPCHPPTSHQFHVETLVIYKLSPRKFT